MRLAAGDLVGPHHAVEPRVQPQLGQRVPDVLGRGRRRHRDRDAPRVKALEQAIETGEGHEPAARQLAVESLLLVREPPQLVVGQRAPEKHREDVAVALAVELLAPARIEGGERVALHEHGKRLGVQRHVVEERPVEVEDHTAGPHVVASLLP